MAVWAISIAIEAALSVMLILRGKAFPAFATYLFFDVAASAMLYLMAWSPLYDPIWRGTQLLMLVPRSWAVMECYRKMASTKKFWRFTDVLYFPVAGCGALFFRLAQDRPLRWPWSSLEQVFCAIATVHIFLSLLLIMTLAARHRGSLRSTESFWHGVLYGGYLSATSLCYFGAAKYPEVGIILMWVALVFYGLRLIVGVIFLGTETQHSEWSARMQESWMP